jgi:hypothetical protein
MSRLSLAHGTSFRGNGVQLAESVPPLIARILSQERFFRDSPPNWSGAPTSRDAKETRERFINRLRRFSSQCPDAWYLAETLSNCEPQHRCISGACPECGRAFQRWFVSQVENLAGKAVAGDLKCVSVIFEAQRTGVDQLADLNIAGIKRSMSAITKKANGLLWMAGGIDLSLNDDRQKNHGIAWQPQIYAIAHGDVTTLSTVLRERYSPRKVVARPVQIKKSDGSAKAISYTFKTAFVQRIAYQTEIGRPGSRRQCWHTRKVSLPPARHVQTMLWMHRQGFRGRVFLRAMRMTRVGNTIGLIQIKKRE